MSIEAVKSAVNYIEQQNKERASVGLKPLNDGEEDLVFNAYIAGAKSKTTCRIELKWIDVREDLPDMYQNVIVLNNGKPVMSRRRWRKVFADTEAEREASGWVWSRNLSHVTHWAPIPDLENK